MTYRIWSLEHQAWWKPAERGYTPHLEEAGQYTLEEATQIVLQANLHLKHDKWPEEAIVPVRESEVSNG